MSMITNNVINTPLSKKINMNKHKLLKSLTDEICDACMKGKMKLTPMTGKIKHETHNVLDLLVLGT